MTTPILVGTEIKEIDVLEMLPPDEGCISITYGRIGTGKTTRGTLNILNDLKRGIVVYANWKIKWDGYDERSSKWQLFKYLIGIKKEFFYFPKENFHYFPITETFIDDLAKLTSCNVHLDEGHIPFDSYEATRMGVEKRSAVFSTRHYDRSMHIYTQRANSVHINLRGNTNRFFKCEVTFDRTIFGKRFIRFLVTEFQDLTTAGTVDETRIVDEEGRETDEYKFAISKTKYWGRKKIFEAFDSKYLRAGAPESQKNNARAFTMRWTEAFKMIFKKNAAHV